MNKPTLTKAQAYAMEALLKTIESGDIQTLSTKAKAVDYKLRSIGFVGDRIAANSISHDDFILALYNGYEVEQTPEEKVREYYGKLNQHHDCDWREAMHIKKTLNLLGIKIEGVNA
jgi:hypothetical protein